MILMRIRDMRHCNSGRMIYGLLLAALLLLVNATVMAQGETPKVVVMGNVYGGGNLADVKVNTEVNMSTGQVNGNVFGGGKGEESLFDCSKAMVGVNDDGKGADPALEANQNKGTLVAISNGTVGTLDGDGKLVEGTGNVYGGGEIGRVEWNTQVRIGVGTGEGTFEPTIYGNVYGAGKGLETHGYSALVRGNSTVTVQGSAHIGENVYGGGENSTVGRYWVKGINNVDADGKLLTGAPAPPNDLPIGMPYQKQSGGICRVTIQGSAEIGSNGTDDKGHVFGAGKGVDSRFVASGEEGASQKMINTNVLVDFTDGNGKTAEQLYYEFLQTLALVTETHVTIDGSAHVKGSAFGGSESGFVQTDTEVKIQGSNCVIGTTTYGNVFGGGKGLEYFAEAGKVKGNSKVEISNGTIKGNVYGGGRLGDVGIITKPADYNYTWNKTDGTTANSTKNNTVTYAANETNINTGVCTVEITGGTIGIENPTDSTKHGNVFGAGRGSSETWWCEKAMAFATKVTVSAGTVKGNVYGGGEVGRVGDDTKVVVGVEDATEGTAPTIEGDVFGAGAGIKTHGYSALVRGNSDVTVQGTAQVSGSVYGGGEIASVGKFTVIGGLPKHPDSGGECNVTIQDKAKIGTSGTGHNVFGACKGVTPEYVASGENRSKSMQLRTNAPENTNLWSDYNGDSSSPFIWRYYATKADYEAFLKTLALTSHPTVTVSEQASVYGSVYGGGERGLTLGNVAVNITGGTVYQDVYGGGALADSNAGNWDADGFTEVTGLAEGASVTGLYTKTVVDGKDVYTLVGGENPTAASGTTYYSKGKWEVPSLMTANYKTTVNLTGGLVKGDAYGGGLGQRNGFNGKTEDVPAVVWGDISVNLGSNGGSKATAFETNYYGDTDYTDVIKSGRVFGCNNLLGSPQGDVTVTVWKTVSLDDQGAVKAKPEKETSTYELAAVYGGGNLAPYETGGKTGKKASVIIHGCDDTSIQTVYGGGNAAPVPETAVDVYSCYEIGALFGGGNGKDKYKKGSIWVTNPGADVNGNANTMIYGGTVHEAYGGSNEKGTISGDVTIDVGKNVGDETCTLDVAKLVGAGKNADVNGDLKIIMGCKPSETIPLVFGGADNANVNGNVELTITSGNFTNVVGGNNAGGAIRGHIKLNVEETTCIPLNIEHLYLCGYNAAYSQYGYYVKTTENTGENATGIGDPNTEHAILTDAGKIQLMPRDSIDDPRLPVDTYSYTVNETTGAISASWTTLRITGDHPFTGYAAPVLNVTSCTHIGEVFGGGYGATAIVHGNPTVNINMMPGGHADEIDRDGNGIADGDDTLLGDIGDVYGGGDAAAVYGNTTVNIGTTTSTSVYQFAQVSGEWKLQHETVNGVEVPKTLAKTVTGAYITGNVYGGGKLADVGKTILEKDADNKDVDVVYIAGSTSVNICAVKDSEILDDKGKGTGRYNYTSVSFAAGAPGVTIGGNVYGGGKGEAIASDTEALAGAFRCSKAMVTGSTSVAICNGTIGNGTTGGSVYGGGEKGRIQENTVVTIGSENSTTSVPVINGNVFGAGQGVSTHGYSALARGNSFVTVQGEAKVKKSVYGGGEIASVGKYNVNAQGLPESLANQGSGYCTVIVRDNAVIGPDDAMLMTATGGPDDYGHVFGAGKGVLPYEGYEPTEKAWRVKPTNDKQDYLSMNEAISGTDESDYLKYVETLGLATQTYVTIDENAFVKGSVYGGSENGYVQHDTQVNIKGNCQIGNGYVQMTNDGVYLDKLNPAVTPMGVNRPYTSAEWSQGRLILGADDREELKTLVGVGESAIYYKNSLPECASWPYGQAAVADRYVSYDKYAGYTGYNAYDGRATADDGHTYYGNVFGGGSGSVPYRPGKWHPEAGSVAGNTVVNISGGHILTNIYGGNELTDVKGKCTVNFGGTATLGVPRTLGQIAKHPVTCYLFGAGKGDPRVLFNKATNVEDVEVNITGGTIYGSVFGGGEDGHVLRDVTMTIGEVTTTGEGAQAVTTRTGPTIGTWGTSYVDGNVFGGGRGFTGDAYTAGNVAGSVKMEIMGGSILGSIYGGGRLGSVGYGLFESTDNTGRYGTMRPDDRSDDASNSTTNFYKEGPVALGRGHIDITISGGTIGNNREYKYYTFNVDTENKTVKQIDDDRDNALQALKDADYIPKTVFALDSVDTGNTRTYTARLSHTKGGNVFAGGMGNFYKQDGVTYMSEVDWWKVGCVKSTKLTITGGTIKSNVYGGGELGQVVGHHTIKNAQNQDVNLSTDITISGSNTVIGTEVEESPNVTKYTFGSVFGGGYGSLVEEITVNGVKSYPKYIAGLVKEDTKVDMQDGEVKASVYGGGEMASVGESTVSGQTTTVTGSTYVSVSGGTVGIEPITVSGSKRYFGGAKMGNVYGGGSGSGNTVQSGKIFKNSNVTISGGTIYHNIYGGGAYGTVGDFQYDMRTDPVTNTQKVFGILSHTAGTGVATVSVTGGTIGYDGKENGMVFGSSRGDINAVNERDDHCAWVYDTHVTIGTSDSQTGPQINGTVYGSGENGHVFNDAEVTVNKGTIGIASGVPLVSKGVTYSGAAYPYRGNVYGGGCGTDKYYSNHAQENHSGEGDTYNYKSGIVYGNATVNINGGTVVRNVYGAGAMGSVGKVETTTTTVGETTTTTTSITTGGQTTINISGGTIGVDASVGDGNVYGAARGDSLTTQTNVALVKNTSVNISSAAKVKGSVYGGGETGDVLENTEVNVCATKQTSSTTGTDGTTVTTVTYEATSGNPTIGGNVFGGGKGSANKFECDKAMVGIVNDGVIISGTSPNESYTLKDGGTTVRIYNGTVGTVVETEDEETGETITTLKGGNVYGGGEIARVERNTVVEIGDEEGTGTPVVKGSVFAAGAGLETHGYSALVRGTSSVTVQGGATVLKNVYGGGEKASVGRYKVKTPANAGESDVPSTLPLGMPARLLAGGASTVNILGSATIGTTGDANTGHVYGAGKGVVPSYTYTAYTDATPYTTRITNSKRMVAYTSATAHPADKQYTEWDYYDGNNNYVWEYFPTKEKYLQFIESLAISATTDVTIGEEDSESTTPTIMGSVFGGSESGFVYRNTDVKVLGGTVHGDAFGGGLGLASFAEAGRVRWNTNLAVSGGAVKGNVYGGGKLGDVGTINKTASGYNYRWIRTGSNGNVNVTDNDNLPLNNNVTYAENETNKNTGVCTVSISGGEIGLSSTDKPKEHGNVFGAGKGLEDTFWCEKAMVYATNVTVSKGTVNGKVYGGGEVGRVGDDTNVTIGPATGSDAPTITGSVFGAGAGLETHGYSALVRGNSVVTVQGGSHVGGSVYGGGEIASVGRFSLDSNNLPKEPVSGGTCTVAIKGQVEITGNVFGACKGVSPSASFTNGSHDFKCMKTYTSEEKHPNTTKGTAWDYYEPDHTYVWEYFADKDAYLSFLKTLALTSNTHTTLSGTASVDGSVYGGGEIGITLGGTDVNIAGGTVSEDVYGGGALADTNYGMWDAEKGERKANVELSQLIVGSPATGYYGPDDATTLITDPNATVQSGKKYYAIYKTNVNLTGGTVNGSVYGGGLGQLEKAGEAAVLYTAEDQEVIDGNKNVGDVKTPAVDEVPAIAAKVYGDVAVALNKPTDPNDDTTYGDCEVKGTIFGCNNLNGSPQAGVDVHVYKTVRKTSGTETDKPDKNTNTYEVTAVYGGGNLAAYYPDDATYRETAKACVTIDGCELTSIGSVYGGGNAASVPETEVVVNGTYEIGELFGGGNGKDDITVNGVVQENPGANVGYLPYTDDSDKAGKDYGRGKAHATVYGGTVHKVYGGSNTKGNVRVESRATLEDGGTFEPFAVGEAYGGGNNADQDGDAVLEIGCVSGLGIAYGGASNADIDGDVALTIINGTYGQVFGGNDQGGAIRGAITVNINETGCRPIIIGELYAGGNRAAYSVYGYDIDANGKPQPRTSLLDGATKKADPQLNVHSFTSIGKIFGGGYGVEATMVASPTVNVNVVKGKYRETVIDEGSRIVGSTVKKPGDTGYDPNVGYEIPSHVADSIGAIGSVYGGGNAAAVIGNPTVNIGTEAGDEVYEEVLTTITAGTTSVADYYTRSGESAPYTYTKASGTAVANTTYYEKKTVRVDIRGNVYGGGNNAEVTGETNVVIGKRNE